VILLDIEGTTTPIAFVTRMLYPYARTHLRPYLARHGGSPQVVALAEIFRQEHDADPDARASLPPWEWAAPLRSVEAYAVWLMDRDRKSPALKALQGYIWEQGYENGDLVGEVYPDVVRAFTRWRDAGVVLGIFSSGSVLAQQWLFRRSSAGDLSPFLQHYFDTRVGRKQEPESYARIAAEVGEPAPEILFVSDVAAELDAARAAGLRTTMTNRAGNAPQPPHDHPIVRSFDQIP
jgi:enolase-phosphatase E1